MKHKVLGIVLGIEGAACVLFGILQTSFSSGFTAAMAFPFEQLGLLLRMLSLSGGAGNAAALLIYGAAALLPLLILFLLGRKRELQREDGLLALLSVVLFPVLYFMTNPGMIGSLFGGALGGSGGAGLAVGKAVLGGTVYSLVCGYFVLRLLRLCFESSTLRLQHYMMVLLSLLTVVFVYLIFGASFRELLHSLADLKAGNNGNEHLLGVSYVFLALQFAVNALPYIFDVLVAFAALRLLEDMEADRYSAESVERADRLARLCGTALAATVLSGIGFNLLQLLFAQKLLVISSSVQIPVFSLAFVLAVLLVARFMEENKGLKDDNDMFI